MALAANALTTVAELEAVLSLASGLHTSTLERVINQASAIAEAYCGRVFYNDPAISEKHPGQLSPILTIERPPLNAITSVTYLNGTAEDSSTTEIHDADVGEIYRISGVWSSVDVAYPDSSRTRYSGAGRKVWTIVYDGGYVTPAQGGTRTLPFDLEFAVIQIAVYLFRNQGRAGNIISERLMEGAQTFGGTSTAAVHGWLKSHIPSASLVLSKYCSGAGIIG